MSFLDSASPALTYLAAGAVCLVVALRYLRRAVFLGGSPVGAAAAAAVVAIAIVAALAMVVLAAFTVVR
ncbi:hypothetical protein [Dactylosporangium sp. NPDC051541]|uniref:hypothetical protein n=1 Tax=Dactylosporangium sp. NPDC051541 TaxID=3363977 RepID=UPI00379FB46F